MIRRSKATGVLGSDGRTREVDRLVADLCPDADFVGVALGLQLYRPRIPLGANSRENNRIDRNQARGLADDPFGRLHGERVHRAPAIPVEADLAREVGIQERPHVLVADSTEVAALRETDDVPGEAIAADVRRLPDPRRLRLGAQTLVELMAVLRAAPVTLSVRTDDEERVLDGDTRQPRVPQGRDEVQREQILVPLELEPVEALFTLSRAAEEERPAGIRPPVRLLHEQEPRMRQARELVA